MSDAVIMAIVGGVVSVVLAYLQMRTKAVVDVVHDLVNSASLVQMRLYAAAARRIATSTGVPADVEAAREAEKLLAEHEAQQAKADTKGK